MSGEAAVDVRDLPEEWLRRLADKHLSEEEKKTLRKLLEAEDVPAPSDKAEGGAEICAKLESNNPAGSVKDRPALGMILAAEREGAREVRRAQRVAAGEHRGEAHPVRGQQQVLQRRAQGDVALAVGHVLVGGKQPCHRQQQHHHLEGVVVEGIGG